MKNYIVIIVFNDAKGEAKKVEGKMFQAAGMVELIEAADAYRLGRFSEIISITRLS